MQRYFVLSLSWITLCGLLVISSTSLAGEGKWAKKADMPMARNLLSTSAVNGKIYIIGGQAVFPAGPALSTVEEYDPVTEKWIKKANIPTARMAFATSVVNGKIYAIGGMGGLSIVEEYDTGFEGLGIEAKGKLVTAWGKIKSGRVSE